MKRLLSIFFLLAFAFPAISQNSTSKGTEFWTAYMEHINGVGGDRGSQMELYVTSDVNTTVTVEVVDGSFQTTANVAANAVTSISIPTTTHIAGAGKFLKGIHITAAKPVAVYAHIYSFSVSGATLLLPVNTMGKEYYAINYYQFSNIPASAPVPSFSIFDVVATEDNTTVEITPAQQLTDGKPKDVPFTVTLKKGEIYQARSFFDLTGSRIRSVSVNNDECKRIAVFSGSSKIGIGCNDDPEQFSSDNLFQQVYPTATWGKNYITTPLAGRNYDIFRVVLSDRTTKVTLNGAPLALPAANEPPFIEFSSTTPNTIIADKPVQVVQYAVTQGQNLTCTVDPNDQGDPEMIFLNPVEQTVNNVTLFSASKFLINKNYVNVVIKTADVPGFRLDNTSYTSFLPMPTNTGYSYARIAVLPGSHTITASGGFNAIAYGFGDHESYGYSAGTNLQNLNEYIEFHNPVTNQSKTAGCTGIAENLRLVLSYQPVRITWKMPDGIETDLTSITPDSSFEKDGVVLYEYRYPDLVPNSTKGDFTIMATTYTNSADICGSRKDIVFDFNVTDIPVAKFTVTACPGEEAVFTNTTDVMGSIIASWKWDFGDGSTSALKDPAHTYTNPGNYLAKLTVTNVNGCTNEYSTNVNVPVPPTFNFTYPMPACTGLSVDFTAISPQISNVTTWNWDFGDGTGPKPTNIPFASHVYANPGTYTATLIATTINGCTTQAVTHVVTVKPSPVVDFTLPDICVNDPFALMEDITTISDGTETSFTYRWNFGDPNATTAGNTSMQKNGQHKYSQPGNYQITLTVRSGQGCEVSVTKTLTVNGDVFSGNMSVDDEANLCSNRTVIFENNAVVNSGSVTRVEWYFDFENNPTQKEVVMRANFPSDGKFLHTFDTFNTPLTKTYKIKMVAYSGETCFQEFVKDITIHAMPVIGLPLTVTNVCITDVPFQIATETNGFTGTSNFSGTGVSQNGLFNPQQAGAGMHSINYTFTSPYSCEYTTSFNVNVLPEPVTTIAPQYNIFEGESVVLNAQVTVSGQTLSYKWEPETGLNDVTALQPIATPLIDTRYKLTVTSLGCTYETSVFVRVMRNVTVPNALSPNGDAFNDTWNIRNLTDYPDCTVTIFNRYGTTVYTSKGYGTPWDGMQSGTAAAAGTYFYVIDLKDGRHKPLTGNITIVR